MRKEGNKEEIKKPINTEKNLIIEGYNKEKLMIIDIIQNTCGKLDTGTLQSLLERIGKIDSILESNFLNTN